MAFINFLYALYEFIIFLLLFCRALTEDFESEPELRRIFRKARVTVRVELRSQLQVWSLFLHFSLPFSTMDGFLKQPQSKLPPPFPRFVRFGYEGDGEDWYKAFQGYISDPKVVPNNERLFERLFPNSVRKLMST